MSLQITLAAETDVATELTLRLWLTVNVDSL
jgi:hypothetical protein